MEAVLQAVGMIEFNSIAAGMEAADRMVKAAAVEPLMMKTVCPGKYLVGVHASVAPVRAALDAGLAAHPDAVVDHFFIPNINPAVITAMSGVAETIGGPAVGIVETFSVASSIFAADAASKAASVDLADLRIAMGLGGKAYFVVSGDVGAVEAAVDAGAAAVAESGLLVRKVVIPSMAPEVLSRIL